MAKTYVTFGWGHAHNIGGVTFDKDCVAVISCNNREEGRQAAFDTFKGKFCMEYHEDEFDHSHLDKYYPRGLIEVK